MTTDATPAVPFTQTALAVAEAFEEHQVATYLVGHNGLSVETDNGAIQISANFVHVRAIGSDGSDENYSIVLDWKTPREQIRTKVFPIARIIGDWSNLMVELTNQGLNIPPSYQNHFKMYLSLAAGSPDVPRVRLVSKMGFFPVDPAKPAGAFSFMLPKGAIMPPETDIGEVLFMPPITSPVHEAYNSAGTLDAWKEALAPAAGNALWVFDACAGFAAVMLEVIDAENFCFHTWGGTSAGKSTGGQIMMSVFGCAANSQQSLKPSLFQNWTTTSNGIETLAVSHSGGGMFLDEIAALPQGASLNIYAILQGRMKVRMNEFGGMRAQHNWRILLLSTGEISLRERIEQEGQRRVMGGEMIRALEIEVDELPPDDRLSREEGERLADHLRKFLGETYGTAGPAYIRALMTTFPTFLELRTAFNQEVELRLAELVEYLSQFRPLLSAHKRALRHFALVYAAGAWAVEAEVSPFSMADVTRHVLSVVTVWLEGFPHLSEQDKLLNDLRAYILAEQFHLVVTSKTRRESLDRRRRPTMLLHDGKLWLSPERFESACGELPMKKAAKMLDRLGFLHRHEGDAQHKTKVTVWPEIFGSARYYALCADRLFSGAELELLAQTGPRPSGAVCGTLRGHQDEPEDLSEDSDNDEWDDGLERAPYDM